MHGVSLLRPCKVLTEARASDFLSWKLNWIIVGSFFLVSLLFYTCSFSPRSVTITVMTTYFNETNAVRNRTIEECLKIFDGRRLWTSADVNSFNEPPCDEVLQDNGAEAGIANDWIPNAYLDDENALDLLSNCTRFKNTIAFPDEPRSIDEEQYPLAYVIAARGNGAQTLRLFRNIYWPQNSYCFALNPESTSTYRKLISFLANCFRVNVLVAERRESTDSNFQNRYVFLENIAACLRMLIENSKNQPWKYVQTISSDSFPLKTNLELINIFPLLNGSNDCALEFARPSEYARDYRFENDIRKTKSISPEGLFLFRGSPWTALNYEFVHFIVKSETSNLFLHWLNGTAAPERYYFSTLLHNLLLGAPGQFPGACLWFFSVQEQEKATISSISIWDNEYVVDQDDCRKGDGFGGGSTCAAGVTEVAWYIEQPQLMAQRFDVKHEPAALYCMEKWHWRKVCENTADISESHYENLHASFYASKPYKDEYVCK